MSPYNSQCRWLIHVVMCLSIVFPPLVSADADDPFADVQQLTSGQLVSMVLDRNPSLPAMRATWESATARTEQASTLDDPTLFYGFAPGTISASQIDYGQRLELSQTLPWPGKRSLRGDVAALEATAAYQDIETVRLDLIAMAKSTFADWYLAHEAIRINRINQDLLQEFRRIAETKYAAGVATKQDVLQAEMEYNLLVHQAIVLERQRRDVLARLNELLNRAPHLALPTPVGLMEPGVVPDAEELHQLAISTRPELKELTARVQSFQARTKLAEREFYPDFKLTASYNSLWDRDEKRFTVGVGINVPLYRGKRRAAVNESRSERKRAEWKLAEKTSAIAGEVQRAYDGLEETRHVLALYRKQLLPIAAENLATAQADYQSSGGDFLKLVTAEKNLMQVQLQERWALTDYQRRLAELARTVGGFENLSDAKILER